MKRRNILTWAIALAAITWFIPLAPAFAAQNQNPVAQQNPPTAHQKQGQKKARTYYGEIIKLRNGKYALMINAKAHRGYYLDDQKDAKKYDQKKVLVTGILDAKTSMLHVEKIKSASH